MEASTTTLERIKSALGAGFQGLVGSVEVKSFDRGWRDKYRHLAIETTVYVRNVYGHFDLDSYYAHVEWELRAEESAKTKLHGSDSGEKADLIHKLGQVLLVEALEGDLLRSRLEG